MQQTILIQISLNEFENAIKTCVQQVLIEFQQSANAHKNSNELLSIKDAAKLLNVTKATLHNWHKKKILEPKTIGNKVLYSKEQIMSAMKDIDRLKYKNVTAVANTVCRNYTTPNLITTSKNTNL